ncbi:MAG: hypothetical protein H7Y30_02970, partial [Pyrinomonadaceae bacterium]|nr:hypothetical protein [Pyrinomonadaceae bacterium]
MGFQLGRKAAFIVAVLVLVCFCFAEANAQRRRTKKSRRVTNPVTKTAATPAPTPSSSTSEPRIISTADETDTGATTSNTRGRRNTTPEYDEDGTRQKVDRLSAQFNTMNEKLSQMEQQQRTLVDLERLTRAETRAENLRAQLRDVQTKESDLQARAEQIEYELQPS